MAIAHFIGFDPFGGHRRYAFILNDALRDWGFESEVLTSLEDKVFIAERIGKRIFETVIFHSFDGIDVNTLNRLRKHRAEKLIAFKHNPHPHPLLPLFDMVVPVSAYVKQQVMGFSSTPSHLSEPAYLPINRLMPTDKPRFCELETFVTRNSEYVWNARKGRDVVLRLLEKLHFYPRSTFCRDRKFEQVISEQTTHIGVVSRLARLKQFPRLMDLLFESDLKCLDNSFRLHFIGAGPWRVVQELKHSIPSHLRHRVYFWGWQPDAYRLMRFFDAILLGLPDKEALGINILEATQQRVPVIGFDGGPFPETIESGINGWLMSENNGPLDFQSILTTLHQIRNQKHSPLSFQMSAAYQERFSEARFKRILTGLISP